MIAALRTELRKVATTRTWWLTTLVMFGYMLVMGVIMAFSLVMGMRAAEEAGDPSAGTGGFGEAILDPLSIATAVYTLAVALGYIFPAILGALSVTGEFRHRTITPTLLAEPGERAESADVAAMRPLSDDEALLATGFIRDERGLRFVGEAGD